MLRNNRSDDPLSEEIKPREPCRARHETIFLFALLNGITRNYSITNLQAIVGLRNSGSHHCAHLRETRLNDL